jgi:DNA-binding SARP family transcriptional activator
VRVRNPKTVTASICTSVTLAAPQTVATQRLDDTLTRRHHIMVRTFLPQTGGRQLTVRLCALANAKLLAPPSMIEGATDEPVLVVGKPLALLTVLACAPDRAASREQLVDLLWADVAPEAGRHTLRQTLWFLRKRMGGQPFATDGDLIRLAVPITSDREDFLTALDESDAERAFQIYTGDFLPGFASPGAAAFEQWADLERTRLRTLFVGAAGRVVRARLETGRAREALTAAKRARDLAPTSQATWRMVLESLVAAGDLTSAKAEAERLTSILAADELEPDPSTLQLLRVVQSGRPVATTVPDVRTITAELVGRDEAFASLLRAFEQAAAGSPLHVHVSAPAGLGKTRLLEGFAARLRTQRGIKPRVIATRATPAERSLPFAFAGQLVTALVSLRGAAAVSPDSASTLVALSPAASTWLNAAPDRSTGDEALRRRALALTELVSAVADDTTIVLLVDDVHWMDAPSRTLVAALAERLAGARVLLVTTGRGAEAFADLTPNAVRLPLQPLSTDDVAALITSVASLPAEPWADLFPARLQTATSGSPLLIIETLQLALERGQLHVADTLWHCSEPADLLQLLGTGRALQQRISALPATARDALLALAVAGDGMNDDSLRRVVGVETHDAMALLETRGLANRVGDSWRPAHDEIAAIATDAASARDRASMHAALADWLESQPLAPYAWNLARAVWHRWRAGEAAALEQSASRFLDRSRANGDAAPSLELLRDALGADVAPEAVRQLLDRLPRRHRRQAPKVLQWVPAIAILCVGVAALWLRDREPPREPDVTFDAVVVDSLGRRQWVSGALRMDDLATSASLELRERPPLIPDTILESVNLIQPTGQDGGYIADRLDESSNERAIDIVRVSASGNISPLISRAHDQALPTFSPNLQRFAFVDRGRWPSQAGDLVLARADGTDERPLTNTRHDEKSLVWAPDGQRVAFVREHVDTARIEVCRLDLRSNVERCGSLPRDMLPQAVRVWRPDDALVVEAISRVSGLLMLVLVSADGQRVDVVDEGAQRYSVAPFGELVLCECRIPGVDRPIAALFSVNQPQRKRALSLRGTYVERVDEQGQRWNVRLATPATVTVRAPDSIVLGERVVLGSAARDANGRDVPMLQRTWRVLDTTIAVVDETGLLTPRTAGTATVLLTAAERLADTASIRVLPPSERVVLRDTFASLLEAQWIPLGSPRPSIVRVGARGELRLNGDARLVSAVVSRTAVDVRRGAGVRVRFRLPLTARVWQSVQVAFEATPDLVELERQSLMADAGVATWRSAEARSCFAAMPRGEGPALRDLLSIRSGGQPVATRRAPPSFGDGAVHEFVLQIFADGRCAFSLDGALMGVSDNAIPRDQPLRVVLSGQSVGTIVAIEEVEAWRGVRVGKLTDTTPR